VQVLFAFLLVVPFNDRFADVSAFQEKVYFGILMCTAFAAAFLIAPSMSHRLLFRLGEKDYMVTLANKLTIAGLTLMALSMVGVILFLTDFVFDGLTAAIAAGALALTLLLLWYAMPLRRRAKLSRQP
jgi:hypothetical protein